MFINTKPLHPTFGVIIEDIDLNQVSENFLYKEIRELFEKYSAAFTPSLIMGSFTTI